MLYREADFCTKWHYFKGIPNKKMAVFTILESSKIGVFLREKGLCRSISFRKRVFFSPICIYKTLIFSILRASKMGFFFEKIPTKGLFPSQNSPFFECILLWKSAFLRLINLGVYYSYEIQRIKK
jgi:hypothetical protein